MRPKISLEFLNFQDVHIRILSFGWRLVTWRFLWIMTNNKPYHAWGYNTFVHDELIQVEKFHLSIVLILSWSNNHVAFIPFAQMHAWAAKVLINSDIEVREMSIRQDAAWALTLITASRWLLLEGVEYSHFWRRLRRKLDVVVVMLMILLML